MTNKNITLFRIREKGLPYIGSKDNCFIRKNNASVEDFKKSIEWIFGNIVKSFELNDEILLAIRNIDIDISRDMIDILALTKRLSLENSIGNTPLILEWDYEKNGNLNPYSFTKNSGLSAWWICDKGHSWDARIDSRSGGTGCPYCSNQKILKGYNDLATLKPTIAKQWDYLNNESIPSEVGCGSRNKFYWICPNCNESYERSIWNQVNKSKRCPLCKHVLEK